MSSEQPYRTKIENCQGITNNINKALERVNRLYPDERIIILDFPQTLYEMDYPHRGFTVTIQWKDNEIPKLQDGNAE